MMSNVAIVTMLPHLKEHFIDTENIEFYSRLMITLPSLSIAFLAPFLGHLVQKIGRKRSSAFALALFGIAGSAGLYLGTIDSLLLSRFFLGIAIAILMIVVTSLVGDYFQGEERHKFMGLQSAFIGIGGVLFVVGGGVLSDIHWRYPFAVYLSGFLLMPLAIKFLFEKSGHTVEHSEEEVVGTNLLGIYFLAFLLMVIFYILPTQMPFLMIEHFGASGTLTGAIIAMAFVGNAFGAMSFSRLKKRFDYWNIYLLGMGIFALGFICIGLIDNVYLFFFTSPLMGFGGGILMTNVSAWVLYRAHHSKRIKSSGYLTSALFLGQFFSPVASHPIVDIFGVQHFFIVVGVLIALGVASVKVYGRILERKNPA